MLPKKGRKLHQWNGLSKSAKDYAELIAQALRREHDDTHRTVKTIMRWTGASERSAKNWLSGESGPSGYFLMRLCVKSVAVQELVLELLAEPNMIPVSHMNNSIQPGPVMPVNIFIQSPAGKDVDANGDMIRAIIRDMDVPNRKMLNERQAWFLVRVGSGNRYLAEDLAAHWQVSERTAKRDIAILKNAGLIRYVGTLRRGRYIAIGTIKADISVRH